MTLPKLYRQIPNVLTVFRIAASPVFLLLYLKEDKLSIIISFVLFVLATLSDFVDGYIARRWEYHSHFGRLLDPIADKVLVIAALAALVLKDVVFWWIAALIILRDVVITLLRLVKSSDQSVVSPTKLAKLKTLYQMVVMILLFALPLFTNLPRTWDGIMPNILLGVAALLSWWTALPYLKASFK